MKLVSLIPLLNVANVDRAVDFYVRHFGFRIDESASNERGRTIWARLLNGEQALMLNEHGEGSPRRLAERKDHHEVVLYFGVDDARALHAKLTRAGLEPQPLEAQDYGVLQFAMYDPDGYELAITSPLGR